MSYNIDTWKTKTLEALLIPISAIEELSDVEIEYDKNGDLSAVGPSECFELTGKRVGDSIEVTSIYHGGEGSGHSWDDLKACLEQSKGKLIATQVWEGGDSITKLTCIDGDVTQTDIEL